eukprot:gene6631-8203_t
MDTEMTTTNTDSSTTTTTTIIKSKIEQKQIDSLPWVEKYRPKNLNDLIAHEDITSTINKLIENNSLPHLLFYGPPGTGKTSTIQAIARKLYGENYSRMVLELNASDDRGIDVVREQIKTFASSMFIFNTAQFKLIILDEADSMTNAAQTALRRVIEKCTRFRFGPLPTKPTEERLISIINQENINVTAAGLRAIVNLGDGDMRKCLNTLQSASMTFDQVNEEEVYKCTGNPTPSDISNILNWIFNDNYPNAYKNIIELKKKKGLSLPDIIKGLSIKILKMDIDQILISNMINHLSEVEYNLSIGASEKLQLGSLIGSCISTRDKIN